jgi:hypothetical protein
VVAAGRCDAQVSLNAESFNQDLTLRGVRMLTVVVGLNLTSPSPAVDSSALALSLQTAAAIELRRTGVLVRENPCTPTAGCPEGLALLFVDVMLDGTGGLITASHSLKVKQYGTLRTGYMGFLTTWSNDGLLRFSASRLDVNEVIRSGVVRNLQLFANHLLAVNPR